MSEYPAKMAIIAPNFVFAKGDTSEPDMPLLVFIDGFAVLKVERQGRGFRFDEARFVSDFQGGTDSVGVLDALTSHIDPDDNLVGYGLDKIIAALVRIPDGDLRDEDALPSLLRLPSKPMASKAIGKAVEHGQWNEVREQVLADVFTTAIIANRHIIAAARVSGDVHASDAFIFAELAAACPWSKWLNLQNRGWDLHRRGQATPIDRLAA